MRTSMLMGVVAAVGGIALIDACGGKAVIDGPPAGSGGAGGTAMTTGGTAGMSPAVVVGPAPGVGGGPGSLCGAACDSLNDCGVPPPQCEERCDDVPPVCRDAHQRWMSCSLGEVNTMCGSVPPLVCGDDLAEYLSCIGIDGDELCSGGGGFACRCESFVSPGVLLQQECDDAGTCTCSVGDIPMGFCDKGDASCGIFGGCCAGIFFTAPF